MSLEPTIDALKSSLELFNSGIEKVSQENLKEEYLTVIEKIEKALDYIDEI
jgi:hypothetical protein